MKGAREQRRRQETRGLHYKPPSSRLAATREEATFGDVKGARLESILGCIRNYVVNKIARRVTVSVTKTRRISRQDVYQDISQYIKTSHMSRLLTATRRISRHLTRGISRHLTNRGISIHLTVYQDISYVKTSHCNKTYIKTSHKRHIKTSHKQITTKTNIYNFTPCFNHPL